MEPATLLLAATFILGLLLLWPRDPEKMRMKRMMGELPGLPNFPILGSFLPYVFVTPEERWNLCVKLMKEYQPLIKFWVGPFPAIAITHPDFVETVLSDTKMIDKSEFYSLLHPWLGTGLLTSTGQKWHSHRKIITPTFHFKILENFVPIFAENCDVLVDKLKKEVGGKAFNVYHYISACTLDIICESAMGTSVNAQKDGNSEYITAVYELKHCLSERVSRPILLPNFIFNLTKWSKIQEKSLKVIHGFTKKVITQRKEEMMNETLHKATDNDVSLGQKKRVAFLDMLLEAAENGAEMTDEEIQEEVDTFMFEGHDTVTAAICFSIFLLGLHPDIQDRVYQELEDIFQDSGRSPSLRDLQNMKYLDMVIKEALRLYPSVIAVARTNVHDFELGPHKIPAGVNVIIPMFIFHLDPNIFPNPTKFNPDNFLPENTVNRHPYAYVPFSAGSRNCIGQKFAMLEVKMVLSSILRHYEVRSVDRMEDLVLMLEMIVESKHGFRICVNPRKSNTMI
ncbi:cytochrome P450 4c21-like [Periplaneta americana]|uniref:cytochrome P450 4c21-like n=1 Tax=Periplaneta americana TaxID=6978 RepID=UPI0037E9BFA2